jgi:hypothetical protein
MDRNRPLPHGTLFDPYREKDFLRRQAEGFPAPKYESDCVITDDRSGYLYATEEFKKKQQYFRIPVLAAYQRVYCSIERENSDIKEEDIVWVGIWKEYYLFQLHVPKNQELYVLKENAELKQAYLIHGNSGKYMKVELEKYVH